MRIRRSVQAFTCLSIVLSATLAAATPATADESDLADGGEWIVMGERPADSSVQSFQGERDAKGACHFDFDVTLAPGEEAIRGDEIRRNTETCESEFAIRKNEAVPQSPQPEQGTSQSALDESLGQNAAQAPAAYVFSIGYMKTWWTDPPGIVVNEVENGVRWYWDNIDCLYPDSAWRTYGWYPGSGWELMEENWDRYANCFEEVSSSYVHYKNWKFCLFIDTHAYYDRNTVIGKWDGWLVGQSYTSVSGGCSDLLSYHFELKRTLN